MFARESEKMFHIEFWMKELTERLKGIFGPRLKFVGLQGSYSRSEETAESDIDVVVILDKLTAADIKTYDMIITDMPKREKICGFISGKRELLKWEKSQLFQFYHDTVPYYGSIDYILKLLTEEDIKRSVLTGACNIYHLCVHNMLHEKDSCALVGLCKSAVFVIQAKYFAETGQYVKRCADLFRAVSQEDSEIIEEFVLLRENDRLAKDDFWEVSEKLFEWAKKIIKEYG